MRYVQERLYDHLARSNAVRAVLSTPTEIPGTGVHDFASNAFVPIPLFDAHIFTGRIRNATLFKRKYFLTSDGSLLAEGMTHSDYFINWPGFDESGLGEGSRLVSNNAAFEISDDGKFETVHEPVIFIGGDTIVEPNWAHWFFEHLLKLRALQLSDIDLELPIVVSRRIPTRFLEWGDLLTGRKLNWLPLDLDQRLVFSDAIIASCPAYRDKNRVPHIWREGFIHLRDNLVPYNCEPNSCHFFSRQSSRFRRAENEDQLYQAAKSKLGAVTISLANLGVEQQIKVARETTRAIFFGGADGPMSLFMPSNARVLEVTAPQHGAFYTCLAFLALIRGYYTRLVADSFVGDYQGAHPLNRNYLVSSEKFKTALTFML